jgi:UDP-N-acetyl-D-galactosamine dehydrogenase
MNTIAVVGLGYVGLPLAVAFGRQYPTIGYDLDENKIHQYRRQHDPTGEVGSEEFRRAALLSFTSDARELGKADFVIIAVPTPVDNAHKPDLRFLLGATQTVGRHMKHGATVVYESTVYPGCTEEECVPVLERVSGMRWQQDFHVGYSPERINPGDREHRLETIVKVVAGDTSATLEKVAEIYAKVVGAGVHRAPSIKVAEAAKVIENTQRDINIALVNELAIIFNKLGIDTRAVLEAAGTKWNFLPFRPGLVGGHCIGVDPYYLTYKAETAGYHPHVVLAGRRINDGMGKYIAEQTIKQLIATGSGVKGATVAVLGLTFKENCPDLRNSRVADIIAELASYGVNVFVHDPLADPDEARREYGVTLTAWEHLPTVDALILAVAHRQYRQMDVDRFLNKLHNPGCVIDVKSILDRDRFEAAGVSFWRL